MRLALHVNDYSGLGERSRMGSTLARVARSAEDAGFARLSLTDHLWQVSMVGETRAPMLEAYTTLGYLAGHTRTIELQTLVTAATYRAPGLLAKIVTTLDVLSGGRAWLGIGAGWNEEEATGLGLELGRDSERLARTEQVIQACRRMWGAGDEPFVSGHYRLERTLNSPAPLSRPRPRILVGGGGERTTLRIAATYADAFNVYGGAGAGQKLARLREHCARAGRDPDAIEATAVLPLPDTAAGHADRLLRELWRLRELGFTTVFTAVPALGAITPVEEIGAKVIPEISAW